MFLTVVKKLLAEKILTFKCTATTSRLWLGAYSEKSEHLHALIV